MEGQGCAKGLSFLICILGILLTSKVYCQADQEELTLISNISRTEICRGESVIYYCSANSTGFALNVPPAVLNLVLLNTDAVGSRPSHGSIEIAIISVTVLTVSITIKSSNTLNETNVTCSSLENESQKSIPYRIIPGLRSPVINVTNLLPFSNNERTVRVEWYNDVAVLRYSLQCLEEECNIYISENHSFAEVLLNTNNPFNLSLTASDMCSSQTSYSRVEASPIGEGKKDDNTFKITTGVGFGITLILLCAAVFLFCYIWMCWMKKHKA